MTRGLGLAELEISTEYRTGDSDPVLDFYRPCLYQSSSYKRAVGFFRSSVFYLVGNPIIEFARRGGKIQLVCSPDLTEEDIRSIEDGYEARQTVVENALLQEIDRLLAVDETAFQTRVLATLVAVGALEVKVAFRPGSAGQYHEKLGIFSDIYGNSISFIGSSNETWRGWHLHGNHEAIEVFCNWHDPFEAGRVGRHAKYFERLWSGTVPGVETIRFPDAPMQKLINVSMGDLERVREEDVSFNSKSRKALPHQSSAIEAWIAAGCMGVFEHATGSGKTFTAIIAIKRHLDAGKPVLILVPSRLLLDQWAEEIQTEIPGAIVMLAGGGNDRWKKSGRLKDFTCDGEDLGQRIVISTMQTASSKDFLTGVSGGDHLMVVADEVHQVGSNKNSKALGIPSGSRLGLSATPTRYGDPEGTAKIFNYFGDVIPPPFTLQDAIAARRLVEYEYFPHSIHLNDEESAEWLDFTKRISLEVAKQKTDDQGRKPITDKAKLLLIQRSRVAKKAANKLALVRQVMGKEYSPGDRWLIYCEDIDQLNEVMRELRSINLNPIEYYSNMAGDRNATLSYFRTFGGILVSIKCLDEGIDIPTISHAFILASSQNPRQFIQRRGRVLRQAPDKYLAVIHDAIVVPTNLQDEPEQLSILKSEFLRAMEFANSAINLDSGANLRAMALQLGLNPDLTVDDGFEDEEEEA
jgi:superfamily II DNA or RNA helicase